MNATATIRGNPADQPRCRRAGHRTASLASSPRPSRSRLPSRPLARQFPRAAAISSTIRCPVRGQIEMHRPAAESQPHAMQATAQIVGRATFARIVREMAIDRCPPRTHPRREQSKGPRDAACRLPHNIVEVCWTLRLAQKSSTPRRRDPGSEVTWCSSIKVRGFVQSAAVLDCSRVSGAAVSGCVV